MTIIEEMLSDSELFEKMVVWALRFAPKDKPADEAAVAACRELGAVWVQYLTPSVEARLRDRAAADATAAATRQGSR
jgi:hypothetical protein